MELGVHEPIYSGCIYFAKELKKAAAYMLNGYGSDRVVVKIDSGAYSDADVRFLGGVMAAVDPSVRPIALTPNEVQEMERWTDETMPSVDLQESAATLKWALNHARSVNGKWVKLKALNLVILDDASKKMGRGDKTDVRIIAASLNAPGGLEKLGQIISADLFIGNNDRFVWPPPGTSWPPEGTAFKKLKTLQNVGNVFVAIDNEQGKGVLAGLDILDPNNPFKNVSKKLAVDTNEWMGLLLARDKKPERVKFCHDVIDDLNYILGPRNRKFGFLEKSRLGAHAANRLFTGIQTGCEKIQGILGRYKKSHGAVPTGLDHRVSLLSWKI